MYFNKDEVLKPLNVQIEGEKEKDTSINLDLSETLQPIKNSLTSSLTSKTTILMKTDHQHL